MGETAQIMALWRRASERGERVCLATVVHVEGSSYRKPGARMLLTSGGERAGTVSGGCLEAEVSRKAWWLTADGPVVKRYQSSFDEDGGGWGLGCGGTVSVLLEQGPDTVLRALDEAGSGGQAAVVVSGIGSGARAGTLAVARAGSPALSLDGDDLPAGLRLAVDQAFQEGRNLSLDENLAESFADTGKGAPAYFVEYLAQPPRLTIFGAGDDAQPIAQFADALGWRVAVADGRSHLLRRERFPQAAELRLLVYRTGENGGGSAPVACGLPGVPAGPAAAGIQDLPQVDTGVQPGELGVVLTHSFEQDRALLGALLPESLLYLGVLGPRHRTLRLLEEIAPKLGWSVEGCFGRLHSPLGLDLGARDPAAIALSIVAELQAAVAGRRVQVSRVDFAAGTTENTKGALEWTVHG